MAKILVAGDAVIITSDVALEDIKTIKKYRPKALVLMGGEDGKEKVFAMDWTKGSGGINTFSASFNGETRDDEKLATITMALPEGFKGDVEEYIKEHIGVGIIHLNKLEDKLPAVLEEIKAEEAAILSNISVI